VLVLLCTYTYARLPTFHLGHQQADFSLPFRPDVDSRNHFTTRVLKGIFQNREVARDQFLELLRQWEELSNAIDRRGFEAYVTLWSATPAWGAAAVQLC